MIHRGKGMQWAEVMLWSEAHVNIFITKHCSDFFYLCILKHYILSLHHFATLFEAWRRRHAEKLFFWCIVWLVIHVLVFLVETSQSNSKEILNGSKVIGYPKVSWMDLLILGMNGPMDLSPLMPKNTIPFVLIYYLKLIEISSECLPMYK